MDKLLKSVKAWWIIPIVIFGAGAFSVIYRFTMGLGASTHLSDLFPWGLWVGFDVLCGVALAAGAFTLSAAVYVLHLDKYKPLVRSAILTGFIGYLLVIFGLMVDLGHPYRIWHPLIMWNPHSVMFEISWCVTLYTTVLALEFSTFLFEKIKFKKALKTVHVIIIPLVILGVILSTLHQSSLGSLFLIVPYKLNPLWYSPWLPVFFFMSALALGCAMVIVESFISSRIFKRGLEIEILSDLGRVLMVVLVIYGIARGIDLSERNVLNLAFQPGFEHLMFLAEILLAIIAPIILLSFPRVRNNKLGLFMSASMVVIGFILNRFNTSMTGLIRGAGTKYLPSWMEISVTISLVAFGLVLFFVAVKYLNIFSPDKPCLESWQTCKDKITCCLPSGLKLLIAVFWVAALALIFNGVKDFRNFNPNKISSASKTESISQNASNPSDYPNLPKDFSFVQSQDSPGKVTFSHSNHLIVAEKCSTCHIQQFSIMGAHRLNLEAKPDFHSAKYCGSCHDGKMAGNDCTSCHK